MREAQVPDQVQEDLLWKDLAQYPNKTHGRGQLTCTEVRVLQSSTMPRKGVGKIQWVLTLDKDTQIDNRGLSMNRMRGHEEASHKTTEVSTAACHKKDIFSKMAREAKVHLILKHRDAKVEEAAGLCEKTRSVSAVPNHDAQARRVVELADLGLLVAMKAMSLVVGNPKIRPLVALRKGPRSQMKKYLTIRKRSTSSRKGQEKLRSQSLMSQATSAKTHSAV